MSVNSCRILAVDDEIDFVQTLSEVLTRFEYEVHTSCSGTEALQLLQLQPFDSVILDLNMPVQGGIETLKRIRSIDPAVPVIILTADSDVRSVVEAMKLGAYDYFSKPIDWEKLEIALKNALVTQQLRGEVKRLKGQLDNRYSIDKLVGKSKEMQAVYAGIDRVVDNHAPVAIEGDAGTGKELLARIIHFNGPRRDKPFVTVNCAAVPHHQLERELFGYSDGGSLLNGRDKCIGKIEQVDGGTLYLDEICEMDQATQVRLLEVLQEQQFERVGSGQPAKTDVRIISASTKNLEEEVKQNRFRSDLFYRVNVYPIQVPSLRDRRSDIPLLCAYFMEKFNKEYKKRMNAILPRTMDYLVNYDWPGNVRELENVLERSFLNATNAVVSPEQLPVALTAANGITHTQENAFDLKKAVSLTRTITPLKDLEREILIQALRLTNFNMSLAATELGIGRTTLYRKLEKYRIDIRR